MMKKTTRLSDATINRIPLYLRALQELNEKDWYIISSNDLADLVGVQPAQLRKDLSYLGEFGTRGVGYDISHLKNQLSNRIGLTKKWSIAVIGAGRLGQALIRYQEFKKHDLDIRAVFDNDPSKIGKKIENKYILDISEIKNVVEEKGIQIGIITTPAESAQLAAKLLVEAGIKAILNFTPTSIEVPGNVQVRHVDLSVELQILIFKLMRENLIKEYVNG
jgi:redox-sensing transcriptional repressor